MRKIKFRAWHSKYGYSSPFGIGGHPEWNDGMTVSYFSSVCQFEQFTGLLDKNGKEIYEGDILKESVLLSEKGETINSQVIWSNGRFIANGTIGARSSANSEIIGNIHETPEILND